MTCSTKRAIKERFVRVSCQYAVAGRSQDVRLMNIMCYLRTIDPSVRQHPVPAAVRLWPGADREAGPSAGGSARTHALALLRQGIGCGCRKPLTRPENAFFTLTERLHLCISHAFRWAMQAPVAERLQVHVPPFLFHAGDRERGSPRASYIIRLTLCASTGNVRNSCFGAKF